MNFFFWYIKIHTLMSGMYIRRKIECAVFCNDVTNDARIYTMIYLNVGEISTQYTRISAVVRSFCKIVRRNADWYTTNSSRNRLILIIYIQNKLAAYCELFFVFLYHYNIVNDVSVFVCKLNCVYILVREWVCESLFFFGGYLCV